MLCFYFSGKTRQGRGRDKQRTKASMMARQGRAVNGRAVNGRAVNGIRTFCQFHRIKAVLSHRVYQYGLAVSRVWLAVPAKEPASAASLAATGPSTGTARACRLLVCL